MVNKMAGGFAPELMGAFVANAQTVAVPLALYGLYSMIGKKSSPAQANHAQSKGGKRQTRRR